MQRTAFVLKMLLENIGRKFRLNFAISQGEKGFRLGQI
jgi:hypothetical protein